MYLVLILALLATAASQPSLVDRIAKITPVIPVSGNRVDLSGEYKSSSDEIVKKAGPPLSGAELHLFQDGTFVYVNWSDVSIPVIEDKGAWEVADGRIVLRSDPSITWQVR